MWIIPSNHPLYSAFAQECVASKEELSELSGQLEQSLMWKSKPLLLKIWYSKWNKVYWLPHLFSRMLKPSRGNSFAERYTVSLEDIHASHSPQQDSGKEPMILDTFGLLLNTVLKNRGLIGSSSRMSRDTYHLVSSVYKRTFEKWVTLLKQESLQRRKLEPLTSGQGSLFSGWKTPSSSECEGGTISELRNGQKGDLKYKLRDQVTWPTPTQENAHDPEKLKARAKRLKARNNGKNGTKYSGNGCGPNLATKVQEQNWPTASARDWKDTPGMSKERDGRELGRIDQLPIAVYHYGHQDQLESNTNGKRPVLNPAWVMQLMGTTLEKTFFAWREMESSNKQQS